ncbi:MAG: UDP-N-acetylmuramate dehydrogenase [Candidatus Omnitrophica bacterium]|nr:UDP-N-acetylmuramate dehydrogenase [Candidatus Omnitrophota bacterium]
MLRNEPLSKHTSFRIGGPAEWFAEPSSLEELVSLLRDAFKAGLPAWVLSGGTNTLASDRGVRGLVIHLGRGFRLLQELGRPEEPLVRVRCGAALQTQRLVFLGAKHGWGALERLAGLPGQVGGAVAMNAQDIGAFVQQLTLVRFDGAVRQLSRSQMRFGYRDAAMEPGVIADVELAFPRVAPAEAEASIRRCLQRRNDTQEIRLPSAGCAFRNPPGVVGAGWLIDQAGLKGARIGDALVSHRHANFIVNLGYASSDHVLALMELIQRRVRAVHGVTLEPELRVMGQPWSR